MLFNLSDLPLGATVQSDLEATALARGIAGHGGDEQIEVSGPLSVAAHSTVNANEVELNALDVAIAGMAASSHATAPAISGVPASNLCGACFQVLFWYSTFRIISPPP